MKSDRFLFVLLPAFAAAGLLPAQMPEPPEVPRFHLSLCAVGAEQVPQWFWRDLVPDAEGVLRPEYRAVTFGQGTRGPSIEVPVRPPIQLYRRTEQEGQPVMSPVMTLPDQEEGDHKLVLFYRDRQGDMQVHHLEDGEEAHPGGEVRVLNLGPDNLVASIGNAQGAVPPGEAHLLGAPQVDNRRVMTFEFAVSRPGQTPFRSPATRLRLRSDRHRLLVVYTYMPTYSRGAEQGRNRVSYTPIAYNLFDRLPEPSPDSGPEP